MKIKYRNDFYISKESANQGSLPFQNELQWHWHQTLSRCIQNMCCSWPDFHSNSIFQLWCLSSPDFQSNNIFQLWCLSWPDFQSNSIFQLWCLSFNPTTYFSFGVSLDQTFFIPTTYLKCLPNMLSGTWEDQCYLPLPLSRCHQSPDLSFCIDFCTVWVCNALLSGAPKHHLDTLQKLQNKTLVISQSVLWNNCIALSLLKVFVAVMVQNIIDCLSVLGFLHHW